MSSLHCLYFSSIACRRKEWFFFIQEVNCAEFCVLPSALPLVCRCAKWTSFLRHLYCICCIPVLSKYTSCVLFLISLSLDCDSASVILSHLKFLFTLAIFNLCWSVWTYFAELLSFCRSCVWNGWLIHVCPVSLRFWQTKDHNCYMIALDLRLFFFWSFFPGD